MSSFKPPSASAAQCNGVSFADAINVAQENKEIFDDFDQTRAKNDPSKCKAILRFPDGTIFWSSKMAIDADGPAAGPNRLSGSQLDIDSGQDDPSFHSPGSRKALPREIMPSVVLPRATSRTDTGLPLGDIA